MTDGQETAHTHKLLIRERGQLRTALTRFETFLRNNPSPRDVSNRMRRIEGLLVRFETVQRQISVIEDAPEGEDQEVADFEERYDSVMLRGSEIVRCASGLSEAATEPMSNNGSAAAQNYSGVPNPLPIKLPSIAIPSFSGDRLEWERFRDMFSTLIHDNKQLSNAQRFHYLKGNLKGEALAMLDTYQITDANYNEAWNKLKSCYDNKRVLLNNHWRAFAALAPIAKESAPAIRTLCNGVSRMMHAIKSLDRTDSAWEDWVVYFMVERLDAASRRDWENSLGKSTNPPTYTALSDFLEGRAQMLEALPSSSARQPTVAKATSQQRPARIHHASDSASTGPGCLHCKGTHYLGYCPKFQSLKDTQRRALVAKLQLCFNCLRPGHTRDACPSPRSCIVCQERHHSALHISGSSASLQHGDSTTRPQRHQVDVPPSHASGKGSPSSTVHAVTTSSTPEGQAAVLHAVSAPASRVILATAVVLLRSPNGRSIRARALLDPGAELSFISEATVQALRLTRQRSDLNLVGVGGSSLGTGKYMVNVNLGSLQNCNFSVDLRACVLARMTSMLPTPSVAHTDWPHLRGLLPLADPGYHRSSRIDLILGADVYGSLLLPDIRQGPSGSPTAQLTTLGWTIFGPTSELSPKTSRQSSAAINSCLAMVTSELPDLLQKFWETEELSAQPPLSPDDEACEQHFASTHRRTSTGRYVVRLPLKADPLPNWTDSLSTAIICLSRLEKRCQNNPSYGDKYDRFLSEYASLGHMQPIDHNQQLAAYAPYYMPHHGVLRGTGDDAKLRVVFNASQKTRSGTSLNDHLLVGPTLQHDIFDVILSWRRHAVAVTADVEKMYRQILVDDRDADLQRIVWRREPSLPICHYRLSTVTYGTACAPYLAIRTMMHLASDEHHRYPRAAEVLRHQSYVDDILFGADDLDSARELRDEMTMLLRAGGFELRKWASTHPQLLDDFPTEWLQTTTSRSFDDGHIKALGLEWDPRVDIFCFQVKLPQEPAAPTKRSILSSIARLFDPLGWIAPAIVIGKIMMQDLWLIGVDWDAALPDDIVSSWRAFVEDLPSLEDIAIPRWIGWTSLETDSYQLHGFADASTRAYAAVVYLRSCHPSGTTVRLLAAKTKVAPVKQLSIPRLELCGAQLLSRLMTRVRSALKMTAVPVILWCDSQVALAWIRAHASRWTTFVANRVSFIQSALPDAQWRHVPTKDNPADLASRGVTPAALSTTALWWNGPRWLADDASLWPSTTETSITNLETRSRAVHATIVKPTWDLISRFSSVTKLWRVTAWCLRFGHNCQARRKGIEQLRGSLSALELHAARITCLKAVQAAAFSDELEALSRNQEVPRRNPLRKLRPFVDQTGVLRVGGRLQRSHLDFEGKHPALLPKRSPLSALLVSYAHLHTLHGGALTTLNLLAANYWILGSKDLVRGHIRRCAKCIRLRAAVVTPVMGDLPSARVTATRPFLRSGVDYAGPIHVRTTKGRGHKSTKGYIALFICLWSKAIHLEVVSDCSTSAFLAAFKRFVSRRGICRDLLSDNGTTFHGADAELRRMFNQSSAFHQDIAELLANDGTSWTFIPPSAPHFGGLWEAGVRSTKNHLRRVIGESTLTFEELSTVLTQIEACLNSRPLTPMSSDPSDFAAITPGHFLIGEPLLAIPEPPVPDIPENRLSRWQLVTRMRDHFWRRWSTEYLHLLQQRSKWTTPGEQLQIGRLVLLKDDNLPPTRWHMGRVTAIHPGSDGIIRVVTIRTATSTLRRPVVKLCPLPE